jgi:tetratricopeptide (TPR) repeat protein
VDALYAYVHRQVTRTGRQTPQKWTYKQEGEIIIARNPHAAAALQPAAAVLGRHFICYSPLDGEAAALRLYDALTGGTPALPAWLDRRDVQQPGSAWDVQVEEALRGCASLLLVVTPDSASEHCDCTREWRRALQYKKPIVPLLFQAGVAAPLYLANRQAVDLAGAFEPALATLREHLAWLATPAGALQQLKDRQADAQRDLRGADVAQQARIRAEMDLLHQQIAAQQQVVDHPQRAAQRVEESIARGLERERQPEKPAAGIARNKFINPPPFAPPAYFQDRTVELALLATFLKDESCRMVTVMGRAGIGKTALACLLLKALERGHLPDLSAPGGDGEPLEADGIVYLSATGTHAVSVPNLYADLCKLLPDQAARELDALYRNPQASTAAKVQRLLAAFPQGRVVVLLDNFENVMDPETQEVRDAELDEALRALLSAPHHAVKVILTTRIAPRDLALVEPGRQARLELDTGLASPYAENVLRAMDGDGTVGLKGAPDDLLAEARERTRGYPRALEALYGILSADRHTTLREVLERAETLLPENVVEALVGEAFSRLDPAARQVMQALAAYDRPVTPAAVDYLLQPYLPGVNSAPVLNRLVAMHLARKEGGRYFLHPVDRAYAFAQIPVGEEVALLHRGAEYFRQARKPRADWKRLEDLAPQLAEFDLRCAAGEYDTAAGVLTDIDFDYLLLWGHYRLMAGLHERLQGRLSDATLERISVGNLGTAYYSMGQVQKAISCYEQALAIAHQTKNRQGEETWLGNLGNCYVGLGQTARAIEYYEQGLAIAREIGDRRGEGGQLTGLGNCYAGLGQTARAIECYEQALAIAREIGYRRGEGTRLGNLGNCYAALGQTTCAIKYHEQALAIAREIGDRAGEGRHLSNLAEALIDEGRYAEAVQRALESVGIGEEISSPGHGSFSNGCLALAHLCAGDLAAARAAAETARQYDEPENNHYALALLGIIALRQGDGAAAQEAFAAAVAQADALLAHTPQYYAALDSRGLALCEAGNLVSEAVAAFRAARAINRDAGIVKRVLRLFDALAVADTAGVLAGVRDAANGRMNE